MSRVPQPRPRDAADDLVQNDRELRAFWSRGDRIFRKGIRGFDELPTLLETNVPSAYQPNMKSKLVIRGDTAVLTVPTGYFTTTATPLLVSPLSADLRPPARVYGNFGSWLDPDGIVGIDAPVNSYSASAIIIQWHFPVAP